MMLRLELMRKLLTLRNQYKRLNVNQLGLSKKINAPGLRNNSDLALTVNTARLDLRVSLIQKQVETRRKY